MRTALKRSSTLAALASVIVVVGVCIWSYSDGGKSSKQDGVKVSWQTVARLGQMMPPTLVEQSAKQLASRPGDVAQRAEAVLDAMAGTSADAAGLAQAREKLAAALPSFQPKAGGPRSSSEPPDVAALKQCAVPLYHGLVRRAGAAIKATAKPDAAATALVESTRAIDGFRETIKGDIVAELQDALGADLYARASAAADAKSKK